MALTARSLATPSAHTREALQALSDTHAANLAAGNQPISADSRAVVVLSDGTQIRCDVNDLSIDGAYLIRRIGSLPTPTVATGDTIKVFLFHPDNPLLESVTLGAQVVRTEANNGPGLAIRFKSESAQSSPPNQLEWVTEVPEPIVPKAYDASAMSAPREKEPRHEVPRQKAPRGTPAGPTLVMTTLRAGRPIFWGAVIGLNIAAFLLFSQWLNSVL